MPPSLRRIFGGRGRTELDRIESSMESALASPLPGERLRMERRILSHSTRTPYEVSSVLLRHYESENQKVRESVERCLMDMSKSRVGTDAIITALKHPSRQVRKSVYSFLADHGPMHATTYAAFFEQTMILLALAKNKGIPVDDIESLVEVSKNGFLDGEVLQAVVDIANSLDLLKHRHRSVERFKTYVVDVLRMAPDLTRMGVFSGRIEEPLKKAIAASKERRYDETSEIIEERTREGRVRNHLDKVGKQVVGSIRSRPDIEPSQLKGEDVWVLSQLRDLMDAITSSTLAGRKAEAMERLRLFLEEFGEYCDESMDRIRESDPSALFTVYTVGVVCVKLFSFHLPMSAEELYQKYFRVYEEEPSVHIVSWPDFVMPA